MPGGANAKREREYEEPREEFGRDGRYRGREAGVGPRIVDRERADFGETHAAREAGRGGTSSEPDVPIEDYDRLTIPEVMRRLPSLAPEEVLRLRRYEGRHKNRVTLLDVLDRMQRGRRGAERRE